MTERISQLEERLKGLTRDYTELEQALNDSINVQEEMTGKENEYKKRIKELTAQLRHFQNQGETPSQQKSIHLVEENKKLKDVIYWLNEDLDDMKQKLNASQGIKSQDDELCQDQANLKASLVNYAKNEEKLKRNENMLENQINQLRLENSELKSKVETHMQVCEEYKRKSQKEIEDLRQRMLNMIDIEVLHEVELEKEHLKKSLASEKKLVSQLRERMELREEEVLKVVQGLKQKYEEEINKMVEECDEQVLIHAEALEVEKEKLENHLKTCGLAKEKEMKRLKDKVDEKQSEVERFKISEQKKLQDANEEILQLEEKNQELIFILEKLENDIKVKETELSETIEKLLVEKEEMKRTFENQMSEIENKNMFKDQRIKELSVSLKDVIKEKKQLEVQMEEDSHRLLNEKKVIVEREREEDHQEEQIENFENLENQVSKGLEEWFFEEKEIILKDYRVENENLRKEFGRANEIIAELREKEVVYNSQIEELQEYLRNCVKKEDYKILQKKIISLENTNKLLTQKIENPNEATQALIKDLQYEIDHLERENKLLKKDLDEVFDEFENLKQEQEKRFKRFSQIKNKSHDYELNGGKRECQLSNHYNSIVGDRQAQLQSLNNNYIEKEFINSEKNDLRKEVQSFVNQLIERSLELDQDQHQNF